MGDNSSLISYSFPLNQFQKSYHKLKETIEGQYLSMRFLKTQLLCSKIKKDGESSRNFGSTSFKNENQEERLKFIYLTFSFSNDFVR